MNKIRILSIDGGGIRGILPAIILAQIEKHIRNLTGRPDAKLGEYVDFIAGTSTGGIIASALLIPDHKYYQKPLYAAADLLGFYEKDGPNIFKRTLLHKVKSLGGLREQKYSNKPLKQALFKQFGAHKLSTLVKPCLIPAYDIAQRKARFFGSHKALNNWGEDFDVSDVALATASAPTYFEPALISSLSGFKHALIDGGVFANNPAMCAYAECRKLEFPDHNIIYPTAKDMLLISIGTGSVHQSYSYKRARRWGAVKWVRPVVDIMMSGNSETVDHQLRQLFDATDNADYYSRLEPTLTRANDAMDDASEQNLVNLQLDSYDFVESCSDRLKNIASQLLHN